MSDNNIVNLIDDAAYSVAHASACVSTLRDCTLFLPPSARSVLDSVESMLEEVESILGTMVLHAYDYIDEALDRANRN